MQHENMLLISTCSIIYGPSNCSKTKDVLISLLESQHGVHSKSLQQSKYRYLLAPIKEIGYFTPITVQSYHRAFPNSIFIFDDVACDKQDAIKEYYSMDRHADVDCFYLTYMQRYQSTYTRQREFLDFFQIGCHQPETRVQQSHKYRHVL